MKSSKLQKLQKKLLKKSQNFLESSKLKIWSLKAELIHVDQQKKKLSETIQLTEERFYMLEKEIVGYKNELHYMTETIFSNQNPDLCLSLKPWKIVQDISTGICKILGLVYCSWDDFAVRVK